MTKYLCIL